MFRSKVDIVVIAGRNSAALTYTVALHGERHDRLSERVRHSPPLGAHHDSDVLANRLADFGTGPIAMGGVFCELARRSAGRGVEAPPDR